MPKLWTDTIETHRHQVRQAIIEATARLVAERGLTEVTMSHVAAAAGIGRATLYKYFADVQTIVTAWHTDQIEAHLEQLTGLVHAHPDPERQLRSVMLAYAHICAHRERHARELNALLHQGPDLVAAQRRLVALFAHPIGGAAGRGVVRADVTAEELATYCVHALTAAGSLPSQAAVERLVDVTLAGMRALEAPAAPAQSRKGQRPATPPADPR